MSTQRYELESVSLLWDNSLDTTLTVPPLPPLDIGNGGGKSKSGSKMGSSKDGSHSPFRFDCGDTSKGKDSKGKKKKTRSYF